MARITYFILTNNLKDQLAIGIVIGDTGLESIVLVMEKISSLSPIPTSRSWRHCCVHKVGVNYKWTTHAAKCLESKSHNSFFFIQKSVLLQYILHVTCKGFAMDVFFVTNRKINVLYIRAWISFVKITDFSLSQLVDFLCTV